MIIWAGSAPEVESVTLMVAGTDTTGCYLGIKMETTLSLEPWEASLKELSLRAPSLKKLSLMEFSLREPRLSQPSFS